MNFMNRRGRVKMWKKRTSKVKVEGKGEKVGSDERELAVVDAV
jgi:hypothetical protein